jgi:hypothetical protein
VALGMLGARPSHELFIPSLPPESFKVGVDNGNVPAGVKYDVFGSWYELQILECEMRMRPASAFPGGCLCDPDYSG